MQVELIRNGKVNYFYASDQFKGMRQDCTVQHLCNEVSASIYEAHGRCALEHGDAAEYNQCQAQLTQHYQAGISGAREEFAAYRLLNQAVHAGRGNNAGVLSCLQSLTVEVRRSDCILLFFWLMPTRSFLHTLLSLYCILSLSARFLMHVHWENVFITAKGPGFRTAFISLASSAVSRRLIYLQELHGSCYLLVEGRRRAFLQGKILNLARSCRTLPTPSSGMHFR